MIDWTEGAPDLVEEGDRLMQTNRPGASPEELRQRALSRWDNEGGAIVTIPQEAAPNGSPPALPPLDVVQLRVRVIALENVVMALLADASDRQLEVAREMAVSLAEAQDIAPHPLTLRAAAQMTDIIERTAAYRTPSPTTDA